MVVGVVGRERVRGSIREWVERIRDSMGVWEERMEEMVEMERP